MSIKERIYKFFGWKYTPPEPRVTLYNVKPNDIVQLEWGRFLHNKGYMKCINNDTLKRKILLGVKWENYKEVGCQEYEEHIFDYNHTAFNNFNLLNRHLLLKTKLRFNNSKDKYGDITDLSYLQHLLNEALEKEEYEEADLIQKRIDGLVK